MSLTPILLSEEDAALFILFQQHYKLFIKMKEEGVFDIEFGKCTINIASHVPQNIVVEKMVRLKI